MMLSLPCTPTAARWTSAALVLAALAALPSSTSAAIYHCRDEAGRLEFRDKPCREDAKLLKKTEDNARTAALSPAELALAEGRPARAVERAPEKPVKAKARAVPSLVGLWTEGSTGEDLDVLADGTFTVVSPMGFLAGDWFAMSKEHYEMTAEYGGRSFTCTGSVESDALEMDCSGAASRYRRR